MRIIIIKPGQPPLIRRALDHLIKGLMLDRANRAALEDREAASATTDRAVDLKRVFGELDEDEDEGAVLIVGGRFGSFPGLMQIDSACDELFGLDCTPAILADAIRAHQATLAIALAAAAFVGERAEAVFDSAKALLAELGEGSAVDVREEVAHLRRSIDEVEAIAEPATFGQPQMDAAVEHIRKWAPGLASWVATVRALQEHPLVAVDPGASDDDAPRGLEECD